MSRWTPRRSAPPAPKRCSSSALNAAHRSGGERLGEAHEAGQVVLADLLALARGLGRRLLPTLGERLRARPALATGAPPSSEPPQQEAGSLATEERRALERDARFVEHLLEVGEPGVVRQRIATSSSGQTRGTGSARRRSRPRPRPTRPAARRGSRPAAAAQCAERRREAVRERQHLRGRAVVLLQPDDGAREAAGSASRYAGAGAGEAVDRLVVVPDRAQLVAVAEPALEQRLLEEVDVLVLVDGEREIALAEGVAASGSRRRAGSSARAGPRSRSSPLRALHLLVLPVDPLHQVGRDRRLVAVERSPVAVGRDAAVPRPLDLGGEVAGRTELVRGGQRVGDLAQGPPSKAGSGRPPQGRMAQLCERRGVERPAPARREAPSAARRLRISPAALSVNVTARICPGANAPSRPGSRSAA